MYISGIMENIVEIPDEVDLEIEDNSVKVSGEKGEVKKRLFHPQIEITKEEGKVKIKSDVEKKQLKALLGTYKSHIQNMIKGVTEGFEYKLKAMYEHFPMSDRKSVV